MNNTPHFKLKFKIEVLEKLQKGIPISQTNNHRTNFEEFQKVKFSELSSSHKQNFNNSLPNNYSNPKNIGINCSKNKHSKYSVRNNKFFTGDIDSLPGYSILTSDISQEEKEELLKYIKSLDNANTLFQSFHLIYSKKFYSKIKCKNGTNIIINIFKELVRKCKEGNFSENNKNESNNNLNNKNIITENLNERIRENDINLEIENEIELYMVLKNVMELNDIDAFEIFNIFKYNEQFSFTEKHFMYLFYLFSSFECNSLNDFITLFGDEIFEELSSNENIITVSRMRSIGEILNIPTKEINNTLQDLKIHLYTPIDQEKFMAYYLNLSKKYSIVNNLNANEGNNLIWNMSNNSNNSLKNNYNNGFVINKNISNKLKENNYSQNNGHNTGNKIYTMGSFNRKENSHAPSAAFNQKRQINNFKANFKSKEKLNKLTKKIHYKK